MIYNEKRYNEFLEEKEGLKKIGVFNYNFLDKLSRYTLGVAEYKSGSTVKNIKFFIEIMLSLGYDEEFIDNYINKNTSFFINNYDSFKERVIILSLLPNFKEELLKNFPLLSYSSTKDVISTGDMYRIIISGNFKTNEVTSDRKFNVSSEKLKQLAKKYPYVSGVKRILSERFEGLLDELKNQKRLELN